MGRKISLIINEFIFKLLGLIRLYITRGGPCNPVSILFVYSCPSPSIFHVHCQVLLTFVKHSLNFAFFFYCYTPNLWLAQRGSGGRSLCIAPRSVGSPDVQRQQLNRDRQRIQRTSRLASCFQPHAPYWCVRLWESFSSSSLWVFDASRWKSSSTFKNSE